MKLVTHILDERYKRKRIAEIEENLKGRYRNDSSRID